MSQYYQFWHVSCLCSCLHPPPYFATPLNIAGWAQKYRESNSFIFFHIPSYCLHISSCFFIFSSYFSFILHNSFIFLHIYFLNISFLFLHISSYIVFLFLHIMSSYFFIFLHIPFIFLHIPGISKNSELLPRPCDIKKFRSLLLWALRHRKKSKLSHIWTWNIFLLPGLGREFVLYLSM